MRVLVTGGAGFVGTHLARSLKQEHPKWTVMALDNLKRRGSELALARLRQAGVEFLHGDVRNPEDLDQLHGVDLILECSAEPSVRAGYGSGAAYLINTNLFGTANCLELARRHSADLIFLSTSRVYPIGKLRALPLAERGDRLALAPGASGLGWSEQGVREDFPLEGHRSLYGATKLASELLISEYREMFGLRAVINRCGVLTGPWQMGKVDQGFFVLWAARHFFRGDLAYQGFGGQGRQVRDVLHVADLAKLVSVQVQHMAELDGSVFNVGGGLDRSVSLREMTEKCAALAGGSLELGSEPATHPADVPWYVTDNGKVTSATGWQPGYAVDDILGEVFEWLAENRDMLKSLLR